MQDLRANTQVIVRIGSFMDAADGVTPETGVTLGAADQAELIKHGSTTTVDISAATWAAVTGIDGWYALTLTTSHTDTEGQLEVVIQDASVCLPVVAKFNVLAEAAWDSLYVAKDDGFMDVNIKTIGRADTTETEATNLEAACAAYSATRGLSGTALPAAAADAAGGLPVSDAGGLDLDAKIGALTFTVAGDVDVNVQTWGGTAISTPPAVNASQFGGAAVTATTSVTIPAASTLATTTGAVGSVTSTVGSVTGSVGSVTGAVGSVTAVSAGAITSASFASGAITAAAIATDAIGSDEIAATAVTKIQTGLATPTNITAGTITTVTDLTNERGKYSMGAVWIGPSANTNTTSYVDGIITNPVSTIAAAKTIADALNLRRFFTVRTGTSQLAADVVGYSFDGTDWSLTTTGGSRDVSTSAFANANVVGGTFAATSGTIQWDKCRFDTGVSVGSSEMRECLFGGTLTLNAAGNYDFIDCVSDVPGATAPVFALGTGAMNIGFRRWSGGITFSGITADDVLTISGELGTIDLGSPSGAADIQIRGTYKAITNVGSATVNVTGAILAGDVASILADTGTDGVVVATASKTGYTLTATTGLGDQTANITGTITTVTTATNVTTVNGLAANVITATSIATDAIGADEIAAAGAAKIADVILRRTQANVEASSDGDAVSIGCLYGLIQQAQESNTTAAAGFLTIYKVDGTTSLGTKTLSTNAAADPVDGIS